MKKTYTYEEVEELCENAYQAGHDRCAWEEGYQHCDGITFEDWKKENL